MRRLGKGNIDPPSPFLYQLGDGDIKKSHHIRQLSS